MFSSSEMFFGLPVISLFVNNLVLVCFLSGFDFSFLIISCSCFDIIFIHSSFENIKVQSFLSKLLFEFFIWVNYTCIANVLLMMRVGFVFLPQISNWYSLSCVGLVESSFNLSMKPFSSTSCIDAISSPRSLCYSSAFSLTPIQNEISNFRLRLPLTYNHKIDSLYS